MRTFLISGSIGEASLVTSERYRTKGRKEKKRKGKKEREHKESPPIEKLARVIRNAGKTGKDKLCWNLIGDRACRTRLFNFAGRGGTFLRLFTFL